MTENTLSAKTRVAGNKGMARQMRMQGGIPGIFYYHSEPTVPLVVDETDLRQLLRTRPSLISLRIDGAEARECVIRELQRDPVSERILHIDLMGVKRGQKLTVTVPVMLTNIPLGVKSEGGILQHGYTEVEVECFPKDIPEAIEVDVGELGIGDSIFVRDLRYPQFRFLDEPDTVLATVVAPSVMKEPVVEEEVVEGEEEAGEAAEGEEAAEEEEGKPSEG